MDEQKFLWLVNEDRIIPVANEMHAPPGAVPGTLFEDTMVLHLNELDHPINMQYFLALWNATFPKHKLAPEQVIYERDGEHYALNPREAKISMPIGVPSERKLVQTGSLGERLVSLIPGMKVLGSPKSDGVHDVDLTVEWEGTIYGVEVKTNTRDTVDPYRYRMTGYGQYSLSQVREAKADFCMRHDLHPGTLGITIDFDNNTFDACFMPDVITTFLGGARTLIARDIPFDNTDAVKPLGAERTMDQRIPKTFRRPGELQHQWNKVTPEAQDPNEIF